MCFDVFIVRYYYYYFMFVLSFPSFLPFEKMKFIFGVIMC